MTPAVPVVSGQNGIETYQAPSEGSGGTKYFVERTPEEIAQELLLDPSTKQAENEEDEIDSLSDGGEDRDLETDQADGGEGGEVSKVGGKEAAGARSRPAKVESSDDPDDLPSYWKKGFVPLSREEVKTLGLEGGQEAVTEYLDKRCARACVYVCLLSEKHSSIVSFKHRPGFKRKAGRDRVFSQYNAYGKRLSFRQALSEIGESQTIFCDGSRLYFLLAFLVCHK